ncbi:carbonic anhydrase [Hazenella coriacea]|uniref:carbonic anhydrase n=1 Tax=Hazenella coriacea TaxID=1179467 RepID=A0A4R3LGK1_9BACL|nr:carbonic anhydrase [Hazenella coriacea]TCS96636.1 carbonic anhydrase [Hazenella coriacea]
MGQLNLKEQHERFVQEAVEQKPTFFEELSKGQSPEYLMIACCDSRVSPSTIMKVPLGHLFIHRNIANQVNHNDESFSASLYFALKHLGVRKVIVKGHTDCGGVKAAYQDNQESELKPWLDHIKKGLQFGQNGLSSPNELFKRNVVQQVKNLKEHPVFKKYGKGVEVIGYLFHVESGELEKVV